MSDYFDLQVNGYGGIDFNCDDLSAADLHAVCARLEADGVAGILATIITEKLDVMAARLGRIAQLRERDALARKIIAGVHIEGPFLNSRDGFRGAHPAEAIVPADVETMKRLIEAADGLTRLVTLAPESDENQEVTRWLTQNGVKVAAGHSDAALDQLKAACDAGLSLFTHLGNGCPLQLERHDNIVQRALGLRERLWCCFIADGAHIPVFRVEKLSALCRNRALHYRDGCHRACWSGAGTLHLFALDFAHRRR